MATSDGVTGTTWKLSNAALDASYVGATMTVAGSLFNNGPWVIQSVLSPTTFTTVAAPTAETFTAAVFATFQPAGTLGFVPDTMNDWVLYAELFAAVTILDKQNLDSTALRARLATEAARIVAQRSGRRDQPYQAPMRRRRGGWGPF